MSPSPMVTSLSSSSPKLHMIKIKSSLFWVNLVSLSNQDELPLLSLFPSPGSNNSSFKLPTLSSFQLCQKLKSRGLRIDPKITPFWDPIFSFGQYSCQGIMLLELIFSIYILFQALCPYCWIGFLSFDWFMLKNWFFWVNMVSFWLVL